MTKLQAKEKNSLIILVILFFILVSYAIITFQWGLVFSLLWFFVVIILVLIILQKIVDYLRGSEELNRRLSSDVESLKESVDSMKEDISEIKEYTRKIANK